MGSTFIALSPITCVRWWVGSNLRHLGVKILRALRNRRTTRLSEGSAGKKCVFMTKKHVKVITLTET